MTQYAIPINVELDWQGYHDVWSALMEAGIDCQIDRPDYDLCNCLHNKRLPDWHFWIWFKTKAERDKATTIIQLIKPRRSFSW